MKHHKYRILSHNTPHINANNGPNTQTRQSGFREAAARRRPSPITLREGGGKNIFPGVFLQPRVKFAIGALFGHFCGMGFRKVAENFLLMSGLSLLVSLFSLFFPFSLSFRGGRPGWGVFLCAPLPSRPAGDVGVGSRPWFSSLLCPPSLPPFAPPSPPPAASGFPSFPLSPLFFSWLSVFFVSLSRSAFLLLFPFLSVWLFCLLAGFLWISEWYGS